MAIAIALAMSLTAALSAVPAAAVSADCTEDFDIEDSESLADKRTLAAGANETGLEDAKAVSGDEEVTVELLSNDDKLEFGIFQDTDGCTRSKKVSPDDCESDVVLDTTGAGTTEDSMTCTIEAPNSGSRDFYFPLENIELNGDSLEYKVYVSS